MSSPPNSETRTGVWGRSAVVFVRSVAMFFMPGTVRKRSAPVFATRARRVRKSGTGVKGNFELLRGGDNLENCLHRTFSLTVENNDRSVVRRCVQESGHAAEAGRNFLFNDAFCTTRTPTIGAWVWRCASPYRGSKSITPRFLKGIARYNRVAATNLNSTACSGADRLIMEFGTARSVGKLV